MSTFAVFGMCQSNEYLDLIEKTDKRPSLLHVKAYTKILDATGEPVIDKGRVRKEWVGFRREMIA